MAAYRDEIITADGAEPALKEAGLDSVGRVLRCLGDHTVAWSRSTDTVRVGPGPSGKGPVFYVKRYHYPKLSRRMQSLIAGALGVPDRARREYEVLRDLRERGLPVVRAVATGQRRRWGLLRSCFLITEGFENGRPLDRLPPRWTDSPQKRRALLTSVAREVAGLHRVGVIHGRLFRRNVLVRSSRDSEYDIRFLDFAPASKADRRGTGVAGDLGALGSGALSLCSATEHVRFVQAYLGANKLGARGRELWRAAARVGQRFEDSEKRRLRLGRLFEKCSSDREESTAPAEAC